MARTISLICTNCGKPFTVPASLRHRKFCTWQCRYSVPPAERFWSKVDKNGPIIRPELGPCWAWKAAVQSDGYGVFKTNGKQLTASRVSYSLHFGEIPDGLLVLHRCDNPPCVNPAHLFLGTEADNLQDCISKGRFVNDMTRTNSYHRDCRDKAESIINELWPGGLAALIRDYSDCKVTYAVIRKVTGLEFRQTCAVLTRHGVKLHSRGKLIAIGHELNPEWGRRIGAALANSHHG